MKTLALLAGTLLLPSRRSSTRRWCHCECSPANSHCLTAHGHRTGAARSLCTLASPAGLAVPRPGLVVTRLLLVREQPTQTGIQAAAVLTRESALRIARTTRH